MTYIGAPTSRIDGHAKVTGAAKYAGEHNVDGLAYAAVVTSTIAKGRIARIDTGEALRVEGVLDILTHENRPPMARASSAYKDDVAPEQGTPLRPLYDDKILFNRQPIALVLAEEWEIARFAASLVRVEYKPEPFATDLFAARDKAVKVEKPQKPRGKANKAFAAAPVRHEAEYFIPIRLSITIRWNYTPRPRSGSAAASSPSTTRPRACRMCSSISAASST
jgi:xanthine dehydrogenase YagR molybdenum-binding subunit